jgi:hypothetical protein
MVTGPGRQATIVSRKNYISSAIKHALRWAVRAMHRLMQLNTQIELGQVRTNRRVSPRRRLDLLAGTRNRGIAIPGPNELILDRLQRHSLLRCRTFASFNAVDVCWRSWELQAKLLPLPP